MKLVGLTPELFWTIFGAVAVAVALLYILKLRRRRVTVPFSPIWGRVLSSDDSRRWWERLKRLLSFLLQLLLAAMIVLAIADPRPEDEDLTGRNIVLLMDTSASMTAQDVSGGVDRFDIAKKEAIKVLESMGPNDSAMLVTMDGQLRPLTPFVKETTIVTQTIKDLQPTATPANIKQAMGFVRDAVRDKPDVEVYLFSDGAFAGDWDEAAATLPSTATLHHVRTGESGQNLAITAFNVRRYIANKLDYEILIEVKSYFKRDVAAELQVMSDGELVDRKEITLGAEATERFFYPRQGFSGSRLEARVKLLTQDARDIFPLDDTAYAVLPQTRHLNILLVTEGNLYLEAPLVSNDNVTYDKVATADFASTDITNYDLVILDRFVPDTFPEKGNYLVVAPPDGSTAPFEVNGVVAQPIITRTRKQHPLLRWVTLKDLNLGGAYKLKQAKGDAAVASAFTDPIILARQDEGRRIVGVAFDVRNSDLPLRVALPVLMINIIDWVTDDGDSIVPTYRTGLAWTIPVPSTAEAANITTPGGESVDVPVYDGKAIFYGEQTGFHRVKAGEAELLVAANLANPQESAILPPEELTIPGREVTAGTGNLVFNRQEYWVFLILAAMAILFVEWLTYNRRWTV